MAVAADRRGALRALRSPLGVVLAALALLAAASALWTLGPEERSLRAAAVMAGWLGVLVGAAVAARTERGLLALAGGVGAIAAVSAAIGLAGAIAHERPYAVEIAGAWRPAGPLEYPPALALLVVCALPVFIELVRSRARAARVAGAVGLLLSGAVLVLAQSRVGLALGLGVVVVLAYRVTRRPAVVLTGAAVALAAGALAFGSGDGPPSGFLHGREDTWGAAVETFVDRPLYGAGADAFLAGSARHQDGASIRFAHNLPLELAAELGILGLILALALYAASGRLAWSPRASRAGWLFGPAVVAFPLANLLDWPWHLAGMGAIWALAGGALAGSGGYAANPPGNSPPVRIPDSRRSMTSKRSIFIAGLCGLALVGAGCGDDDDNGALSYDDSVAELNEVCGSVDDIGQGLTGDPENDAPILAEATPKFEGAINDLRDLEVAEELESARDDFVANGQDQLDMVEKAQAEAEAGDKKAYTATLEAGEGLDKQSNALASKLGAEECVD